MNTSRINDNYWDEEAPEPPALPQTGMQFYHLIVSCFIVYIVYIVYIVLLYYCFIVLLFYCFIVFIIVLSNIILSEELYEDVEVFS